MMLALGQSVLLALVTPVAMAAITCDLQPEYAIIAEGQPLELTATCRDGQSAPAPIETINWRLNNASATGDVVLSQATAAPVTFNTPANLGASNTPYIFTVTGFGPGTTNPEVVGTGKAAHIVIKSEDALAPVTQQDSQAQQTYKIINGACGAQNNQAVTEMPAGSNQCAQGKPTLRVTANDHFSWTCASTNGGSDAGCYALKGYTVTGAVSNGSGCTGTVSPTTTQVTAGNTTTFQANPGVCSVTSFSADNCAGVRNGNFYTTGAVNSACTVTASFALTPVSGACATISPALTQPLLAARCSNGAMTANSFQTSNTAWTWTCDGTNGGSVSNTCSAARQYTATVASITGGTLSFGNSSLVTAGQRLNFTATPNTNGNVPTFTGTCNVTANGNGYQTDALTSDCTMSVTFAAPVISGCGSLPSNVTLMSQGGNDSFPFNSPGLTVDNKTTAIKAYPFVNNMGNTTYGTVFVERGNQGGGAKNISISTCPGVYAVANPCKLTSVESGVMKWTNDGRNVVSGRISIATCKIEPGTTYYLNVGPVTTNAQVGYILGAY